MGSYVENSVPVDNGCVGEKSYNKSVVKLWNYWFVSVYLNEHRLAGRGNGDAYHAAMVVDMEFWFRVELVDTLTGRYLLYLSVAEGKLKENTYYSLVLKSMVQCLRVLDFMRAMVCGSGRWMLESGHVTPP